ncbi:Phosphodiest-domain-containing protein [Sarocladium strictum]
MPLRKLDTRPVAEGGDAGSLLSPIGYDDDASSIHSRSDQDTDSEDDELQMRARNSRELLAHDRIVLMEEEEMDQLVSDTRRQAERQRRGSNLAVPNPLKIFGRRPSRSSSPSAANSMEHLVDEKREARKARRQRKKTQLLEDAQHGEDGELMYEMEEGGMKDGSSTGESSDRDDSDEVDRQRLSMHADNKRSRGQRWRRWLLIHLIIAVGFAMLVLGAWKMSKGRKNRGFKQEFLSNGTALFAQTTIILSLDGFRADFLSRGLTPRLNTFVKQGVSPKYMLPSFPSVTFPNHYTLATGLYPESHGVVGNTFWDPELKEQFYYTHPDQSMHPKWWGGEPFWVTAERQGIRSAIHMWPGSEAHILGVEPSFMDKYNGKEPLSNKVSKILEYLDKPGKEDETIDVEHMRPQLIAAYVPNVDADGHKYGPNSTEIRSTIENVDNMLDEMFTGLEERNLTDIVNVMIVSDHGMATTDVTRLIQLEDLIDTDKIEHIDGWPLYGLRPKDLDDLQPLYETLAKHAETNDNIEVYLRDKNMPERYHFSKNDRIAPLWIVPKTGWAIVTKDEFNVEEAKKTGEVYHPRGLHGYDHEHPLMRAIFIARGPAFPHPAHSQIDNFQNIEVYNMLCDSIGLEPMPNNGTLRLPLKPIGLHDSEEKPQELEDPVSTISMGQDGPDRPTIAPKPSAASGKAESSSTSKLSISEKPASQSTAKVATTSEAAKSKPTSHQGDDNGSDEQGSESWWDWITGHIDKVWHKITGSKDEGSH